MTLLGGPVLLLVTLGSGVINSVRFRPSTKFLFDDCFVLHLGFYLDPIQTRSADRRAFLPVEFRRHRYIRVPDRLLKKTRCLSCLRRIRWIVRAKGGRNVNYLQHVKIEGSLSQQSDFSVLGTGISCGWRSAHSWFAQGNWRWANSQGEKRIPGYLSGERISSASPGSRAMEYDKIDSDVLRELLSRVLGCQMTGTCKNLV